MASQIRNKELMGQFIGQKLLDVSEHDEEDFDPKDPHSAFLCFMFEGGMVKITSGDRIEMVHAQDCDCSLCVEGEDEVDA